jgi:hypothetical protein
MSFKQNDWRIQFWFSVSGRFLRLTFFVSFREGTNVRYTVKPSKSSPLPGQPYHSSTVPGEVWSMRVDSGHKSCSLFFKYHFLTRKRLIEEGSWIEKREEMRREMWGRAILETRKSYLYGWSVDSSKLLDTATREFTFIEVLWIQLKQEVSEIYRFRHCRLNRYCTVVLTRRWCHLTSVTWSASRKEST